MATMYSTMYAYEYIVLCAYVCLYLSEMNDTDTKTERKN